MSNAARSLHPTSNSTSALPPLYLDIACDGRILYDPTGYMQRKLRQIRPLIRRLGLVRQRRGQDIVWTWEASPKAGWTLRWEEAQERTGTRQRFPPPFKLGTPPAAGSVKL